MSKLFQPIWNMLYNFLTVYYKYVIEPRIHALQWINENRNFKKHNTIFHNA
jgi:hypothetical protein